MSNIQRITWIPETGSTNDLARDDFLEKGTLWHCFVADSQTNGRGRKGRSWISPPGTGLYLSIAVPRPGILEAWLPLTCAIALSRAIQSVITGFRYPKGVSIKIKWPNDLYIGNGKVAGILCELAGNHKNSAWIIGIGINVNTPKGAFPEDLRTKACSISSAIGSHVSRKVLLDELLPCLSSWLDSLYRGDVSEICSFLEKTEIVGINSGSGTKPQMQADRLQSPGPLGITMGCPAGIGPEIIIKAFASNPEWSIAPQSVVVGDVNVLERASRVLGINIPIRPWSPGNPPSSPGVHVYAVTNLDPSDIPWGEPSPLTGKASFVYIAEGINLCQAGSLSGLVTAPISKLGLRLAGIPYPGHTEILADMTGTERYAMMLAGNRLRVTLVSIHCPLRDVAGCIDTEKILQAICLTDLSLKNDFGIGDPEIAVAALNPHAGESGMFGNEEKEIIAPAVEMAKKEGIKASGPYPPDTLFYRAVNGKFDAVVCQYHDQGLIPFKLLHFRDGVNVTLGLPIVRTSVDHGTAYDIAGTGRADSASLEAAVNLAAEMVANRLRR